MSIQPPSEGDHTAASDNDQIGLVGQRRRCSWTNHMLDWIALADPKVLPAQSVRLYWILKSFITDDKGEDDGPDRVVHIVQEDLADMMHCSVDTIQRALRPLYNVGLVQDKERRKVSTRVPGSKRPTVTTLLIMQVNETEPPEGYAGWVRPFQARKEIRARRKAAGDSDTASVRPHNSPPVDKPVGNEESEDVSSPEPPTAPHPEQLADDVSPGDSDTADLPENGADLPENGARMRHIGSTPPGNNLSGTGGANRRPPRPPTEREKPDQSACVVSDQGELIGDVTPRVRERGPTRETPAPRRSAEAYPEPSSSAQQVYGDDLLKPCRHCGAPPGRLCVKAGGLPFVVADRPHHMRRLHDVARLDPEPALTGAGSVSEAPDMSGTWPGSTEEQAGDAR